MPLYEYECDACGVRFERIRKFSDPPIEECPSCGGRKVQKLVSSPAIQFKGSGWYITDYARKGAAGTGADKSDGAKTDATKTDPAKPSSGDTKSSPAGTASSASTPAASTKDS